MQKFRPNDRVKVLTGKYAGLVGEVQDCREKTATVRIQGVQDNEPVDVEQPFNLGQLDHAD